MAIFISGPTHEIKFDELLSTSLNVILHFIPCKLFALFYSLIFLADLVTNLVAFGDITWKIGKRHFRRYSDGILFSLSSIGNFAINNKALLP